MSWMEHESWVPSRLIVDPTPSPTGSRRLEDATSPSFRPPKYTPEKRLYSTTPYMIRKLDPVEVPSHKGGLPLAPPPPFHILSGTPIQLEPPSEHHGCKEMFKGDPRPDRPNILTWSPTVAGAAPFTYEQEYGIKWSERPAFLRPPHSHTMEGMRKPALASSQSMPLLPSITPISHRPHSMASALTPSAVRSRQGSVLTPTHSGAGGSFGRTPSAADLADSTGPSGPAPQLPTPASALSPIQLQARLQARSASKLRLRDPVDAAALYSPMAYTQAPGRPRGDKLLVADKHRAPSGIGENWSVGYPQQLVIRRASDAINNGTVWRPPVGGRLFNDMGSTARLQPLMPAVVDAGMPKFT